MSPNQQQSAAWNGPESAHYVDHADRYDRQLAPVIGALIDRARIQHDERVLDIGCGSGVTSLRAAGLARSVLGVDISVPLLEVASRRARAAGITNVELLVADAQIHRFDADPFDVLVSQFGLMFFDEPVGAFTNLRRALRPGGRIVFTAWRSLTDNEWLAPVVRAVAEHAEVPDLGGLANGPGMFAFRHDAEVTRLLAEAGFVDVAVDSISPTLLLGGGGSLQESVDFLLGMGIVRGLMGRLDDPSREAANAAIRAELAECFEPGRGVSLGASVWLVSGRSVGA